MNEHDLLIEMIGYAPHVFQKHPEMRDNPEYIKASMTSCFCIANWNEEQQNNRELILEYVRTASDFMDNDNSKYAVKDIIIRDISEQLAKDESFIKDVLRTIGRKPQLLFSHKSNGALYSIHQDTEFLHELADIGQAHAINVELVPNQTKKDKELIKKCVSQGSFNLLSKADYNLRNNLLFAYECMKLNPECSMFFGAKINDATPGASHGIETFIALENYLLNKKLIKSLPPKGIKQKVNKI